MRLGVLVVRGDEGVGASEYGQLRGGEGRDHARDGDTRLPGYLRQGGVLARSVLVTAVTTPL